MHEGLFGSESNGSLILLFRNELKIILTDSVPSLEFSFCESKYRDIGNGDWNGFYDWLRGPDSRLLGVRYWPFDERQFLFSVLPQHSYLSMESGKSIKVYFSDRRDFAEEISADQEFGNDIVFVSENGEYAISFSTKLLSESDIHTLLNSGAQVMELGSIGSEK